jgi:hypothetical protein
MTQYYRTDFMRLSWVELWRTTSTFRLFLFAAIRRLLNAPVVPHFGFAHDGLRFIEADAVPEDAKLRLQTLTTEWTPLGFRLCAWYTMDMVGAMAGYSVAMLDGSGTIYASAIFIRSTLLNPPREQAVFSIGSKLTDGRFVSTTNARRTLNPARGFLVVHLPDQDFRSVLRKHQERILEFRPESIVRLDDVSLREAIREATNRVEDFHIERGVWAPLSAEEVAAIVDRCKGGQTPQRAT